MIGKVEIKNKLRGFLDPLVDILNQLGVTPLAVTLFGLALSFIGAIYVASGRLTAGAVILIISGICDTLDGSLARRSGSETAFGAFIDSTGDRVTEMAYFGALIYFISRQDPVNLFLVFFLLVALAGSFLTSYARARAEGLGLECTIGWVERPERLVLLVIGLLLGRTVLITVILILAILTVATFIQRVLHVRRIAP